MIQDFSLLDRFEAERPRLRALAYRMLGSSAEADDAVQEAWLGAADEDRIPQEEAELADSVGLAMLVVLNRLSPAERIAFVLHDMFDVPFDDIAHMMERRPAAVRQLASRARLKVRGTGAQAEDPGRRRQAVEAYLAATRTGDFERC